MSLFYDIDDKLAEYGFIKISEDKYGVSYKKYCPGYIHNVDILHKENGRHILQSYDPDLFDTDGIGNTNVGLTYKELKLFTKKMKKLCIEWKKENKHD